MGVVTRFAPSPTGYLHLGGLRTALFNFLFAKSQNGKFLLRIEDTDQTRLVHDSVQQVQRALEWVGITADLPVVVQSQRLSIYRKHVDELLTKGKAYHCFCTTERLASMRDAQRMRGSHTLYDRWCLRSMSVEDRFKRALTEPHTVRLLVEAADPAHTRVSFDDVIHGKISTKLAVIDDQVLLKTDGFPTYHLANVVDDHLMGITHVIRGEEWLPSTSKHVILYQHFGWTAPTFVHLPLIINPDGSKLSKRQNDVDTDSYRRKGFLPEAVVNFLACTGWTEQRSDGLVVTSNHQHHHHDHHPHHPSDANEDSKKSTRGKKAHAQPVEEVFDMSQLLRRFTLSGLHRGNATANFDKLRWLNAIFIRRKSVDDLFLLLRDDFINKYPGGGHDAEYVKRVIVAMKERSVVLTDFVELSRFFFVDPIFEKASEPGRILIDGALIDIEKSATSLLSKTQKRIENLTNLSDHSTIVDNIIHPLMEDIKHLSPLDPTDKSSTTAIYKKRAMQLLRVVAAGGAAGTGVTDIISILGKDVLLRRNSALLTALQ